MKIPDIILVKDRFVILCWFAMLITFFNIYCPSSLAATPQLSAGGAHSVVLKTDGTVWAWGGDYAGQLGNGEEKEREWFHFGEGSEKKVWSSTVQVKGLDNIISIVAGLEHNLALKEDGTVWAWGNNRFGQVGKGIKENIQKIPVQVEGIKDVTHIDAGFLHSVALESDGTVWVWGSNKYDQLGNGTKLDSYVPIKVQKLNNVVAIASGNHHNLALKADGTLWAWGANRFGQIGDGTVTQSSTLTAIPDFNGAVFIKCGNNFNIVQKTDNSLWAWGNNAFGQFGNGTNENSATPIRISGPCNFPEMSIGGLHCLILLEDGTVRSMGYNRSGQLGVGTTSNYSYSVFKVRGLENIVTIAAGNLHSIAMDKDGTIWAWGNNDYGQLGDGTNITKKIPVRLDFSLNLTAKTPTLSAPATPLPQSSPLK